MFNTRCVEVQDGDLAWLGDWLQPGLSTLATLLLGTSALEFHSDSDLGCSAKVRC